MSQDLEIDKSLKCHMELSKAMSLRLRPTTSRECLYSAELRSCFTQRIHRKTHHVRSTMLHSALSTQIIHCESSG